MTEKEKMLQGKIYDCMEEELYHRRLEAGELCIKYNSLPEAHTERKTLLKEIFPQADDSLLCIWFLLRALSSVIMAFTKSENTIPNNIMVWLCIFLSIFAENARTRNTVASPAAKPLTGKRNIPKMLPVTPVTITTAAPSEAPAETPIV